MEETETIETTETPVEPVETPEPDVETPETPEPERPAEPAYDPVELREGFMRIYAGEMRRRSTETLARASARSPEVIADELLRQADELEREYPSAAEAFADERFRRLVRGGATVREAFEALHGDLVREAAAAAERQRIRERGMRPPENGASAPSAVRASASALTPAARADIARRAQNGERISF